MKYPYFSEVNRYREITTEFRGYDHSFSCAEGEFFDMKNMTSAYYPVLSPRIRRGIVRQMQNPLGLLEKGSMVWVDGEKLYVEGVECTLAEDVKISTEDNMCPKKIVKMGAYIVIMPDKVWYNAETGESGCMESTFDLTTQVKFSLTDSQGKTIEWHDAAYYEETDPEDGDYMMISNNGTSSLKQYSKSTSIWATVATTYVQITATGIGTKFKKEDGIKITVDTQNVEWEDAKNIFVNEEEDGTISTNTCIYDLTDDCITIVALLKENKEFEEFHIKAERKVPDMEYITECQNRLWGCSKDGHEIYCCKLGDVNNWNCFQGISTDSYAATIGSDGKFTGAITFLGYPIFFKEDSLIKVMVSGTGAHQTKETVCRGVQNGSERSLCILNEVLYYKSATAVCAYSGGLPVNISDALGEVRYYEAVGGTINNKYYISMKDSEGVPAMFVYDYKQGIWSKEDETDAMYFCRYGDELYFIDRNDKKMKSVGGTTLYFSEEKEKEEKIKWYAESGNIGYTIPDNKYVARINVRISLEIGAEVDFYLQYDSSDEWEHKFRMAGAGTRTFAIPVTPKRCDHFKYKISGNGDAKIYSITKTIEQGSDV